MPKDTRQLQVRISALIVPSDLQVVGGLTDEHVELFGWETDARSVWIRDERIEHIRTQRRSSSEADFCVQNISAVVREPVYWRRDRKHVGRVGIVGIIDGRPLQVSLKLVSKEAAHSNIDEIWVSTAFPLSSEILSSSVKLVTLRLLVIG